MGRNEIKIRRNNMTEGHIARHRNYGLLMKRHRRDLRIRKLTIVLIYLLIIVAVTVLYIVVKREEQHRKGVPLHPSTARVETIRNEELGIRNESSRSDLARGTVLPIEKHFSGSMLHHFGRSI